MRTPKKFKKNSVCRRGFLQGLGLGAAGLFATQLVPGFSRRALASSGTFDPTTAPFLIYATFEGGWDQLLALDPRSNLDFTEQSGIHAGYDVLAGADPEIGAVLNATNGTGVVKPSGSNISFGPAVGPLSDLYADLCVLRGVDMGTLTHEVGRRYFLTGKFPRGLSASGSSMSTWLADQTGDLSQIPNLVVGLESYNEGLAHYATGLSIKSSTDLQAVLAAIGTPLSAAAGEAVDDYMWRTRCVDAQYDEEGMVTTFMDSREKAKLLSSGELAQLFAFQQGSHPDLYSAFDVPTSSGGGFNGGINNNAFNRAIEGATGQAMIAAQAITHNVSQAVSIRLASGIDHHDDDYQSDHSPALRDGFTALANLITYLKTTKDEQGNAYWDRTVIVASSDFARTPHINSRGGRDHHLASSVLVAGGQIAGNTVIGATDDQVFGSQPVDPDTGMVADGGVVVRPPDIHATVLQAMGLGYDHISNQDPVVLGAMLK